jgi:hypothetical protein
MQNLDTVRQQNALRTPWNKGKLLGANPPFRTRHVWSIRTKLQVEGRTRELAMFNLAIDSKLRGCDVVSLKVEDAARPGARLRQSAILGRVNGGEIRQPSHPFGRVDHLDQRRCRAASAQGLDDGLDALTSR